MHDMCHAHCHSPILGVIINRNFTYLERKYVTYLKRKKSHTVTLLHVTLNASHYYNVTVYGYKTISYLEMRR